MLAKAANSLLVLFKREWLIPFGILLFSFLFRVMQIDTAFFGPEQGWIAQAGWEIASLRDFHTFMFQSSVGYHNFPLTYYLTAIAFFFSDEIYAPLLFYLMLNLVSVGLCWYFTRRYWGWQAAALAAVVYSCMPWATFFSYFIWNNTLIPPLVMLWVVGCGMAFAERRARWLMLAWGAAWLAIQLHVSGILLLATLVTMMCLLRIPRAWRYALVGSTLAIVPALPWLYAQITGTAQLGLDFSLTVGEAGLRIDFRRMIEFLTARDLTANFISEGWEDLASQLVYMRYLAPFWLLLYGGALLFLVWCIRRVDAKRRPLILLLTVWCFLSLGFTVVADAPYTIVYYLPMLPAPCIALALMCRRMTEWFPPFRLPIGIIVLALCALNLNAVWSVDRYINNGIRNIDVSTHALPVDPWLHPPPLVWQMEVAREIRARLDAGEASELILIQFILLDESQQHSRWPFPYHLGGYGVRVVNVYEPHLLYPERATLYLRSETDLVHNGGYEGKLVFLQQVGPYHLYRLPGNAGPAPQFSLPERPAYENGLRLVGYDALGCDGNWQLHWMPDLVSKDGTRSPSFLRQLGKEVERTHFFVHLLDADGEGLAQSDLRTYDVWDWRPGDHVITTFDFDQDLRRLPIETIRVGLYSYSDETKSFQGGIYALDEQGRPWVYAVDIPFEGKCVA